MARGARMLITTSSFPAHPGDNSGRFVLELAVAVKSHMELEVHVCTPARKSSLAEEVMDGVHVHRYRYHPAGWTPLSDSAVASAVRNNKLSAALLPSYILRGMLEAVKLSRRYDIDIMNSHWLVPQGLSTSFVRKLNGAAHICTLHAAGVLLSGNLPGHTGRIIARTVYRSSDALLPVSDYIRMRYLDLLGDGDWDTEKIPVIPMGTDVKRYKPDPESGLSARRRYGLPEDGFVIGYLGRLDEKKGVEYLIDALKILKGRIEFTAFIGGRGPLEDELKSRASSAGLSDSIRFLGFVPDEDMPALYNAADVVAVPSIVTETGDTEGMPVVLMEAMACGRPVVASDISSVARVVTSGENGTVVKPRDPESIARSVEAYHADSTLRRRHGEAARRTALKLFSWGVVGKRYAEVIKSVLDRSV